MDGKAATPTAAANEFPARRSRHCIVSRSHGTAGAWPRSTLAGPSVHMERVGMAARDRLAFAVDGLDAPNADNGRRLLCLPGSPEPRASPRAALGAAGRNAPADAAAA